MIRIKESASDWNVMVILVLELLPEEDENGLLMN